FPNAPFYPAGFTPRFYGTTQEFFGTVGYKGVTGGGLHYDVSGSSAQNSLTEALRSTVNPSLGPLSPGDFYIGKFVQRESNLNIDLSYPWQVAGFASPLSVAAGLEYRDETYQQLLGEPASYVTGPYGAQALYNCAGTTCTPALDTGGHQIINTALTGSNGYHAPTPGQSNVETISTTFLPGSTNNVQIGTYPVTSKIAQIFGASALRPEESTNLAGGVVLTFPDRTLLTIDAYSMTVRHRI